MNYLKIHKVFIILRFIITRKIAVYFLLLSLTGLLADRFIPHEHHETNDGIVVDFPGNEKQASPKEDKDAGEKIHSAFFLISLAEAYNDLNMGHAFNALLPAAFKTILPAGTKIFVIEKYLLLKKILNLNLAILRYFIFKAPPLLMHFIR